MARRQAVDQKMAKKTLYMGEREREEKLREGGRKLMVWRERDHRLGTFILVVPKIHSFTCILGFCLDPNTFPISVKQIP